MINVQRCLPLLFIAVHLNYVADSAPVKCSRSGDCKSGFFCHRPLSFCLSCSSICDDVRSLDRCYREDSCRLFQLATTTTTSEAGAKSSHTTTTPTELLPSPLPHNSYAPEPVSNNFFIVTVVTIVVALSLVIVLLLIFVVYHYVKSKQRNPHNVEMEARVMTPVQEQDKNATADRPCDCLLTNNNR